MSDLEIEIVRLVQEISDDEKKIREAEADAADAIYSKSMTDKYEARAKRYKDSLERKMQLLKLLKG